MAPAGAVVLALLSLPAGAASGNCVVPGAALFAYGSALVGGGCCWGCGAVGVCAVKVAMATAVQIAAAKNSCLIGLLRSAACYSLRRPDAGLKGLRYDRLLVAR